MAAAKKVSKNWLYEKLDPAKAIVTDTGFENLNPKSKDDLPKLMTIQEVADYFHVHRKTIEAWKDEKNLFFFKINGSFYTTPQHVADYIANKAKNNG